MEIPLEYVLPPTKAVRTRYDREALRGLIQSVEQHGVLNPIIVVKDVNTYRLVAGMRRFLAATGAKLETIPANVVEADSQEAYELGLVENIQREEMNPIDEAKAVQSLMRTRGIGTDAVARQLGKSGKWATGRLQLLGLGPEAQAAVKAGEISLRTARNLVREDEQTQRNRVRIAQTRSPRPHPERPPTWREKAGHLLRSKLTDEEGAIVLDAIERTIRDLHAARGGTS